VLKAHWEGKRAELYRNGHWYPDQSQPLQLRELSLCAVGNE